MNDLGLHDLQFPSTFETVAEMNETIIEIILESARDVLRVLLLSKILRFVFCMFSYLF